MLLFDLVADKCIDGLNSSIRYYNLSLSGWSVNALTGLIAFVIKRMIPDLHCWDIRKPTQNRVILFQQQKTSVG